MNTDQYYQAHADQYASTTVGMDMAGVRKRFLEFVGEAPKAILDAGSGSGRDTLAFLKEGYSVQAIDSCPALAEYSTQLTGVPTQVVSFQDFQSEPLYDAVWACASVLHVPLNEQELALSNLIGALKKGGTLYVCYKYGSSEGSAPDGRHYTYMDELTFCDILSKIEGSDLIHSWSFLRDDSSGMKTKWLNLIVRKA